MPALRLPLTPATAIAAAPLVPSSRDPPETNRLPQPADAHQRPTIPKAHHHYPVEHISFGCATICALRT